MYRNKIGGVMNDQEKSKETLIRELNELRQRVMHLESRLSDLECERKKFFSESSTNDLPREQVWRLPGYWH